MKRPLGYGLIGCGGFGTFCLEQYRAMPELRCVAVADLDPGLARATATRFGLAACASPEALLARDDIDLVHIATPPFTHRALSLAALEAGKHVLCEKPLATTLADAREMVAASRDRGRLLAVNLIMRYNPLCEIVRAIVHLGLLGEPLHAHFVNDASDETLPPAHWFWDRARSGGIFVEHGVHFFDLFEWWFGPGTVLSAQQAARPGGRIIEHVSCTVRYRDSALVDFYHGFHQPSRGDHQEWRLAFELGSISMREWVPTSMRIDLLASDATLDALRRVLPAADVQEVERYRGAARLCTSRHQPREVDGRFALSFTPGLAKLDLYGTMLRALLEDQIAAIRDPAHARRIDESNGITSLVMAVAAQERADLA